MESLLSSPYTFSVRIGALIFSPIVYSHISAVPVRNTDFGHLRDGFIRAVQARMKATQLGAEESQVGVTQCIFSQTLTIPSKQVNESLQVFKTYFPPSKVPKGNDLTLTKTRSGDLVLSYKVGVLCLVFVSNSFYRERHSVNWTAKHRASNSSPHSSY